MDKVFSIDYRNNITLNIGDNGLIDFSLCDCEELTDGDVVRFKCADQVREIVVRDFICGVAKIQIAERSEPFNGRYCILVEKDGRKEVVIEGKFIRKGGC